MADIYRKGFFFILLVISFIWFRGGLEKILGGTFVNALGPILTKFASNNPYPWYKNILNSFAIPNAQKIAPFVMLGEITAGLLIIGSILYMLFGKKEKTQVKLLLFVGLCIGFVLNLNFWLASGWTSPSADSLNLVMLFIEAIGIIVLLVQGKKDRGGHLGKIIRESKND